MDLFYIRFAYFGRCFGPRRNHLPPVRWPIFRFMLLNDNWCVTGRVTYVFLNVFSKCLYLLHVFVSLQDIKFNDKYTSPWWRNQHYLCYWTFVREIHRSPVNSPHKGQWRGALMFSLIYTWTKGWVNNLDDGDVRRHCAHCDITAMLNVPVRSTAQWLSHVRSCWTGFGQTGDTNMIEIFRHLKMIILSFKNKHGGITMLTLSLKINRTEWLRSDPVAGRSNYCFSSWIKSYGLFLKIYIQVCRLPSYSWLIANPCDLLPKCSRIATQDC